MYKIKYPPEILYKAQIHSGNISGITMIGNLLLSIGEDGKMCTANTDNKSTTCIKVSESGLTNIIYEGAQKRLFLSDKIGNVVLYSTANMTPLKLESVPTGVKSFIRCMEVDFSEMIIFIITDNGILKGFNMIIIVRIRNLKKL